jgi:hypothetical protein
MGSTTCRTCSRGNFNHSRAVSVSLMMRYQVIIHSFNHYFAWQGLEIVQGGGPERYLQRETNVYYGTVRHAATGDKSMWILRLRVHSHVNH